METVTMAEPSAKTWIDDIRRSLPTDPRSRNIVVRAVLFLSQARHAENFIILPIKIFNMLKVAWPSPRARPDLNNIVCVFSELDDQTIATIQDFLREAWEENYPQDSLRAHFAATFGATCVNTEHDATDGDPWLQMTMLQVSLRNSVDVLEDFTMTVDRQIMNEDIYRAIEAFYAGRGYSVDSSNGFVVVKKNGAPWLVRFSNYSASGTVMVTVQHFGLTHA